jgi:hypothetical protein
MAIEKTKISELSSAAPLGEAVFPIVQNESTFKCSINDIKDFLTDLSITSFTITPSKTDAYEVGDRLTSLQLNWRFNKIPNAIEIILQDSTSVFPSNTDTTYTDSGLDITSGTKTWRLSGIDSNVSASNSKTINWVYPFFYGMVDSDLTDGTGIYSSSLTKLIKTKSNKSITLNGDFKHIYFAYPSSYGDLNNIKDPNNFDITGQFTKYSGNVSSTGLDENYSNISYNIYSTYPNLVNASGTYKFNF